MITQQRVLAATVAILLLSVTASAKAPATAPDPILSGPAPGPCAAQGAQYVPGVDATGHAVTPAEGPDANPGPDKGMVLLTVPTKHGRTVTLPVDLAELAPQACKTHQR